MKHKTSKCRKHQSLLKFGLLAKVKQISTSATFKNVVMPYARENVLDLFEM